MMQNSNLACLRKHKSNYLTLCGQSHLFGQVDPYFKSCDILRYLLRNSWQSEENGKAHSRTSLSNIHSESQKLRRENSNVPSFAKHALPSFPRDQWRNCRLNSSNSIGSECCVKFVIFSQPMVRVMIIHGWVTTFIVVHDRFTTNGYALPVPRVLNHKMDLQWKPQSNLYKTYSHLVVYEVVIKISTALHSVFICICK